MGLDRQPTKALQHALDDLRDRVTALLRTGKPVVLLEESGGGEPGTHSSTGFDQPSLRMAAHVPYRSRRT